jgi:stage V sporulation protein D (sporulation-specific penicillin-binding protein)
MSNKNILKRNRTNGIMVLGGIVFLLIVAKLYQIQIINGNVYNDKADKQYTSGQSDVFDRGSIYFTDKAGNKISAATVKTGYKISINPSVIENPEDVFNNLVNRLDLDEEDFLKKISKTNDPYEEIAKRADPNLVEDLIKKDIKGISFYKEKWRFYPGKNLASQVVGFMSYKDDNLKAQYGLERYYDDVLERRDVGIFKNFFVELFSGLGKTLVEKKHPKGSIVTTIEPSIQGFTEKSLEEIKNKYNPKTSGIIIMNPKNGEIYAMALNPGFDLNEFNKVEDPEIYKNKMIENSYEMGSIVKPLTVAAGIDLGVISAETTYNDTGEVTLNGSTIRNYDKKARGVVTMQTALNNSLNTGMVFAVQKMGNKNFAEYMKKMLGPKTGIDLPNEAESQIKNLEVNRDLEYANASFGQGIAMTPIAITRALATLGNGGFLVTPHIVKAIDYDMGFTQNIDFPEPKRIFKQETSEDISRMLVTVVDKALRGGTVALPNYSIAAKTGTAQIAKTDSRGYYDDRYLHSFFGYFPAYDPKFIVFLYAVEPQGANYASETLTDSFMNITKYLINYYDIPPDR